MRLVDKVILHCSASDLPKQDVAMITQWHKRRGFRTIGYHYFIQSDGTLGLGRPESEIGAHVEGHNASSIGICLAGYKSFYPEQFVTLRKLLSELKKRYPASTLHGHREFANKECPVFDYAELKKTYEAPPPAAPRTEEKPWKTSLPMCKRLLQLLGLLK